MGYRQGPLGGIFRTINPDFHRRGVVGHPQQHRHLPDRPGGADHGSRRDPDRSRPPSPTSGGNSAASRGSPAASRWRNRTTSRRRSSGIVRENSTYYVLGFNSADERRDGRYIRIEVRVKRPGSAGAVDRWLRRAARQAAAAAAATGASCAAVWDAVASPLTTSGVPMRVFAAPFKGKGKDATVAITLEIAANRLNLVEAGRRLPRRARDRLRRHRQQEQEAPDHAASRRGRAQARDVRAGQPHGAARALPADRCPKGTTSCASSAGGAALAGSVVYDLVVPDFRDDFSMSGIALTSSQTGKTFTVSPHARIDVGLPGPPTTAREFSQDDTLTLFAEVYENRRKPHTVYFTIELRDAAGELVGRHTHASASRPPSRTRRASTHSLRTWCWRRSRRALRPARRGAVVARRANSLTRDIPITVR